MAHRLVVVKCGDFNAESADVGADHEAQENGVLLLEEELAW
jgi:hypothetical protein